MAQKSRDISKEKNEVQQRLAEIERLEIEAQNEEKRKLEFVANEINSLCNENNVFCGVILSTQDLLAVMQLAIESKENISIPFRIYYKE